MIKRKLDLLGERELEAWTCTRSVQPLAADALGLSVEANTQTGAAPSAVGATSQPALTIVGAAKNASTWQRTCLLPGLELMVATDASPSVLRAAHEIAAEYVGAPAELSREFARPAVRADV